jgi:hypothetical protein
MVGRVCKGSIEEIEMSDYDAIPKLLLIFFVVGLITIPIWGPVYFVWWLIKKPEQLKLNSLEMKTETKIEPYTPRPIFRFTRAENMGNGKTRVVRYKEFK